jgi:N-acetylglutamate synthase-like GNAT family acetyltransferase
MDPIVRPATAAELQHLPTLLPRWQLQAEDQCLVAEASRPSRVVGIAALRIPPVESATTLAAPLDVVILPRFRSVPVLRSLVTPLLDRASRAGCREVHLLTPLRRAAPEFAQFQELDFAPIQSLVTYEFDVPTFVARISSLHRRLVARRTIPVGAKVLGLTSAHWPAAIQLVRSERLIDPHILELAAQVGYSAYFHPVSRILVLNGQIKGVLLVRAAAGRQAEITALAVTPGLRGGASWANALLSYQATVLGAAVGYEIFTMKADPARHPMTTLLAKSMKARTTEEQSLLGKFLTVK